MINKSSGRIFLIFSPDAWITSTLLKKIKIISNKKSTYNTIHTVKKQDNNNKKIKINQVKKGSQETLSEG